MWHCDVNFFEAILKFYICIDSIFCENENDGRWPDGKILYIMYSFEVMKRKKW